MRGSWRLALVGSIVVATSVAACGSSTTGSSGPSSSSAGASAASTSSASASAGATSGQSGGPAAVAHTTAIAVCKVLDEPSLAALVGFPAKFFGAGDPVARVPVADRAYVNAKGAALRIGFCGYWETGTKPELSRDVTIELTQGDPAKPGTWSTAAAHDQYAIFMANTAAPPATISGLGDEAFSVTNNGSTTVTVRSGDLIVRVEGDAPPLTTALSTDALQSIAKAFLAKV